ncbi:alpha-amylase family glycosyl hydrolase, partial [Carnobacterium sp. 1290_CSPC]
MTNDLGKKVIYQVYPKSFNDTDGDGFGDLRGIIEKLDYLETLGVDMIWMNPFYPSPQNDNGYDISDYTAIDPRFGTMDDFEELAREGKKRGIDLMLDMPLNHSSTEHEWFQKALAGDEYYQDFYYIRPAQEDGSLP